MAEKIYTIPVNDAFDSGAECPVCAMYKKLEDDALSFMMGPSYMEDDIRMETDKTGYCKPHMTMLLKEKNRLGLALILKTHLDRQKYEALEMAKKGVKKKGLLKKGEDAPIVKWAREKSESCYICDRIQAMYPRYMDTILYLYRKDEAFREKYRSCKGFCQAHLGELISLAQEKLSEKELQEFADTTVRLYTENLERVSEDLDWFRYKFDYRYREAPWKNAKDSIERGATKSNSVL